MPAFHSKVSEIRGVHRRNDTPEDEPPPAVRGGSLDHVLFITLTVAIDCQRDADSLWESSRNTVANAKTRHAFNSAAAMQRNRRGFARN